MKHSIIQLILFQLSPTEADELVNTCFYLQAMFPRRFHEDTDVLVSQSKARWGTGDPKIVRQRETRRRVNKRQREREREEGGWVVEGQ